MNQSIGAEGIYFVVRLPVCWRLIAFRFDEHPENGHPDFWEAHVAPLLEEAWAPQALAGLNGAERQRSKRQLKLELGLHYDGFPRGRVTFTDRFIIYHGNNLKRGMKLTRRSIELAFGIEAGAAWIFDEHEQCSAFSAEALRAALRISEKWNTATPSFD